MTPNLLRRPSRIIPGPAGTERKKINDKTNNTVKHVMLYFGSFNPIHKGHIALAEYAIEKGLCDEVVLVVSPQNPLKPAGQQAPELDRFSMAETACAASKYPDKIKPSVIEFMLDKPSYTIHTLRHLTENYGTQMRFSILMGDDLVPQLPEWKEHREILDNYPIFVYPRTGQPLPDLGGRITLLEGAPLYPYSSSEIRERLGRGEDVGNMLPEGVMQYIREKDLWSPASYIASLTARLEATPDDASLYVERGQWHYRRNEWGEALNDFNRALQIDPDHREARQFVEMTYEILSFRHTDIYNP